jgi:TPR repeat protein
VDKDLHKAAIWLSKAAETDPFWTPELCDVVAESGDDEARKSFLARVTGLCDEGSRYGYLCMGRMCRDGIAMKKDPQAAADWFRKAADSMDSAALDLFDVLWALNDDENNREMMNIAYRLAEAGNSGGMGRLGSIYRYGRGVPKNLLMAERWTSKACAKDPSRWTQSLEAIRKAVAEERGDA